jgi:trans-2,3-dihydro-3-hydroxyanthranilate isomerase
MQRRYVTTDVFTDRIFGGNQLAVVLDAEGLDTARMQAIAAEFNYAETTFVLPPKDPAHTANVRIFTRTLEMPFAGHPNVGTAFVLSQQRHVGDHMVFEEIAGLVPITLLRESGRVVGSELTAPQNLQRLATADPARIAACLSLDPSEVLTTAHPPTVASVGALFLVVELASRDALRRVRSDIAVLEQTFPMAGASAIFTYTRDGGGGFDIHARMLAPLKGNPEDSATGSATVTLAALLADLGPDGETRLRVQQGFDMGRPSTLLTRTVKRDGVVQTAQIAGHCVLVMRGTIEA